MYPIQEELTKRASMNDMHVNSHSKIGVHIERSDLMVDLSKEGADAVKDQVRFAIAQATCSCEESYDACLQCQIGIVCQRYPRMCFSHING